jgi:hypothetical protein
MSTLERDPEDGQPKPKKWQVTFTTSRTVEVEADSAADAEEKARDDVLHTDEFPIDREEITDTFVGWINPEPEADQRALHVEGCWGNHCRHYDCETGDCADSYDEWCSQCDIDAY